MDRLAFNGLVYRQPITTRLAASLGVILRRHILVTPRHSAPLHKGKSKRRAPSNRTRRSCFSNDWGGVSNLICPAEPHVMRHHVSLYLAAALLFTATSASSTDVSDYDRFRLWNDCRPMDLLVEDPGDEATAIDVTREAIVIAVRSRLRAARLYREAAWSYLYFNVNVVSSVIHIGVEYNKEVVDRATMLENTATTWGVGSTGTHSRNPNFILSSVSQHTDKFIDEYLRVNADACK